MANDIREQPDPFGWMRLIAEHKEKVFQLFGDLSEYFRLLRKETDRGCAMIVAAHLDDKLGGLPKSCMIQSKEEAKGVAQFPRGPLGTFANRYQAGTFGDPKNTVRKNHAKQVDRHR